MHMVEGPKDDALKCVMHVGREEVVAADEVLKIAKAIKGSLAGKVETATMKLFRE